VLDNLEGGENCNLERIIYKYLNLYVKSNSKKLFINILMFTLGLGHDANKCVSMYQVALPFSPFLSRERERRRRRKKKKVKKKK
jgi:hypothetical protein